MRPGSLRPSNGLLRDYSRGKLAGGLDRHRQSKRRNAGRELDLLIYRANIEIVAVDQDQAEIARIAWRRFGKGRHPAALNYGDCFAYALAKSQRLPLLYLGHDFSQTDVESVP
jgi:uncharacterized protein with PIN domain